MSFGKLVVEILTFGSDFGFEIIVDYRGMESPIAIVIYEELSVDCCLSSGVAVRGILAN